MTYYPNNPNGQATMANSSPVVLSSDQSAVPVTVSGVATAANQTTLIGHVDGVETLLGTIDTDTGGIATSTASIDTKTPALGQALAAASVPVVLTAAQVTTLTPPAAITGFALETTLGSVKTAVETIDNAISGSEMQVDVVTSALPTGASTAAKQPALGTAGTASADVITVQGIASMTALKVDGSGVTQPVSGTVTVTATNLDVQSGGADLATSTQAGAIQTAVELIDDTVKVLGTDTYTEATSKGITLGAVRRDADTTLVNTTNEFSPLQVDANGRLKVEAFSGETLPVSLTSTTVTGTVAVTQSGTWDEVGINDSGNSITVDYATTGSGTSTGALRVELPTNGTGTVGLNAGTNAIGKLAANSGVDIGDVDVTSVNGFAAHDAAIAGNPLIIGGVSSAAAPTSVTADQEAVRAWYLRNGAAATVLTAAGALIGGDASNGLDVDVTRVGGTVAVTQSGTWDEVGINDSGNSITVDNGGTFAVQVDGSALTALQKIDDPVLVDDAAFTPATSSVTMAGFQADETATDSVDEGDAGAARMTLDRKVIVTVQPHTAGGWSVANCTTGDTFTALTNSAQVIKASAGSFGGYYYYNPNATASYINVYDVAAASVTVGTTTPKLTYCIPPTAAANIEIVHGIPFGTAMSASATTTGGGNTAPSTALEVMFWYK